MLKMRSLIRIAVLTMLFPFGIQAQPEGEGKNDLRIMTYNVRNAQGMDNVTDYKRIADVINNARPTVVALQELDSVTGRSHQTDVLREIAERTLMHRVYAPAINFDGGKYGVGVLSRERPLASRYIPLPGKEEKRVLLIVEFEKYFLACTHLSLTEADRMASIAIIRAEAANAGKPFFLAGDLNAKPDSPIIAEWQKDFKPLSDIKKPTFPADEPRECIDYIGVDNFYASRVSVLGTSVINEPLASDHRPVLVSVRLKAAKEEIFRTQPYLQNPVDGGITIMWQTHVPTYSWVEYGTDTLNLKKAHTLVDGQALCNGLHNKIRLENLQAGKKYYYRVCSREITIYRAYYKEFGETAMSTFSSFTLPSADTQDFTALIFNDLHKQEATLNALYEQVKDIPCDFVFFNGDCIDDPATENEVLFHLSMQCKKVNADTTPVFYIRGNHEIRNAYSIGLRSLFDYVNDKTYHAFNWGDTRFVILDCGEDKPDSTWVYYGLNDFTQLRLDQVDFLKDELASEAYQKAGRRVLLNHIPLFGGGDSYSPCRELWGGLLKDAPFDVNLSAHTHRFAFLQKGSAGNNFPVVIGGSSNKDSATVMVLQRRGNELKLRVIGVDGKVRLELDL
ncbi:MAG: endonuclease/exonuclease/phosphatase family protein [Prolixibacteraceae bacterium]|nr:endonuclease/exonuclease/phosphatase family protein [Prolixibacteraceae bacterium]